MHPMASAKLKAPCTLESYSIAPAGPKAITSTWMAALTAMTYIGSNMKMDGRITILTHASLA